LRGLDFRLIRVIVPVWLNQVFMSFKTESPSVQDCFLNPRGKLRRFLAVSEVEINGL